MFLVHFTKMTLLVTFLIAFASTGQCVDKQKVLLLSLKSFRPDYVEFYNLSSFKYLMMNGVHARLGMKPSFSTDTVTNLYTVATGLYSESHGVLANYMWDPALNDSFHRFSYNSKWWEGGEPIWVTAKRQGKKIAVYSWPGSEAKIQGVYPDIVLQMLNNIPITDQIDTIVDWFKEEEVDLIMTNLDFSFYIGYIYGTHHEEMVKKIKEVDNLLDYLIYRLATEVLIDTTNIIIVSDHGLINVTQDSEHVIDLSKYVDLIVDLKANKYAGGSLGLWTKEGRDMYVYKKLLNAHPNMKVYTKEDIPKHLHVKNNKRCPPLWVFAEEGYVIKLKAYRNDGKIRGMNGYSSELMDNRAVFYASGPAFKQNYVINELESVNIYLLICHILDIKAAPNNGSLKVVKEILKEVEQSDTDGCNSLQINLALLFIFNVWNSLNWT